MMHFLLDRLIQTPEPQYNARMHEGAHLIVTIEEDVVIALAIIQRKPPGKSLELWKGQTRISLGELSV